jgi:hypothetical protein
MQQLSRRVSQRFRALDRKLHIDHRGRSEWIWAVPILTLVGTFGLIVAVGVVTAGVTAALYVPIGLIVAALTAGMSIAYMTPEPDAPPGDDRGGGGGGGREPGPQPAPPRPSWARWLGGWRDEELPDEPAAPPRRREPEREREREHAGSPR